MRTRVLIFVLVAASSVARADKRTDALVRVYTKQATICETRRSGLQIVVDGATELQTQLPAGADLEGVKQDTEKLKLGLAAQTEYCTELADMLAVLGDAKTYASVAKEHAMRAPKIRKHRTITAKLTKQLDPVSKRLIPRFQKPTEGGKQLDVSGTRFGETRHVKYPNGRGLDLPPTNGTWRLSHIGKHSDTADYTDAVHKASLYVEEAKTGSCEDERIRLAKKIEPATLADDNLEEAKAINVAWNVRYAKAGTTQHYAAMCMPREGGGFFVAGADIQPTTLTKKKRDKLVRLTSEDFSRVLVLMIKSRASASARASASVSGSASTAAKP